MGSMTSADDETGDAAAPEYARGGLVKGPDGGDTVAVLIDPRYERIFTAEEVRRYMAAKPGSRDALGGR
jgi:hypothetical protein